MSHLLHIDSSARYEDSVSRAMTALFVEHWRKAHPQGKVTYLTWRATRCRIFRRVTCIVP